MRALILVDLQNAFMPEGSLAIPDAQAVISVANQMIALFARGNEPIIATQNWFPNQSPDSLYSVASSDQLGALSALPQDRGPHNCLQHSTEADFVASLEQQHWTSVVRKGANGISFSGFTNSGSQGQADLHSILQEHRVTELFVLGLATDYCVKFTVLDARGHGYNTTLIVDGCRGLNLQPTGSQMAIREMEQAGARLCASIDVPERCSTAQR